MSHDAFVPWIEGTSKSKLLALVGDMGCGKTITSAYVMDKLALRGHLVCSYYYQDDCEDNIDKIYRSLLRQLSCKVEPLRHRFLELLQTMDCGAQDYATTTSDKLRNLLCDGISQLNKRIFVIIDGLDEYDAGLRTQLFKVFQELFEKNAPLQVFVSTRYRSDIEAELAQLKTIRIELRPSGNRDRIIATYLCGRLSLQPPLLDTVVDELSRRAQGSAIWLQIAVEYINKSWLMDKSYLDKVLGSLPSSRNLAKLYQKLFNRAWESACSEAGLLQRALESLAAAGRPLTFKELIYAASMDLDEGKVTSVAAMKLHAQGFTYLKNLIRPFVIVTNGDGRRDPELRLVHQSLKDLIIRAPPRDWHLAEQINSREQMVARKSALHGMLLRACIRYLLLEECGTIKLIKSSSSFSEEAVFLLSIGGVFDNDGTTQDFDTSQLRQPQDFDPSQFGLGSFFAYAAAYWTHHFSNVSPKHRPDPRELQILCERGSWLLNNWVQQWRRPGCTYKIEREMPEELPKLDPLVLCAMFGPSDSLTDILKLRLSYHELSADSAWTAISHLSVRGDILSIKRLLLHKTTGQTLLVPAFFNEALTWCSWSSVKSQSKAGQEWEDVFSFVINRLHRYLWDNGNYVLCRAANSGCLPLIKELFRAAEKDNKLHEAILSPKKARDPQSHQSIGEAAKGGHANVMSFLCKQDGIMPHMVYTDKQGNTVFHMASKCGNPAVFEILIQYWSAGINIRNSSGDTPLNELIFSCPGSEANTVKLVELLLRTGNADATGRYDPEGMSPLCTAVRGTSIALCNLLIDKGRADIHAVIGIDERTGRPFLKDSVNTMQRPEDRDRMLRMLCTRLKTRSR
jgi:hypothetical protein